MDPKIVSREGFRVMGIIGHFSSAGENFGPLWQDYMKVHEVIEPMGAGPGHYGVYLAADHSQQLDYLAGMAVRADATASVDAAAPEVIETRDVPAATYAVFGCEFKDLGPTYGFIWDEWLAASDYEQDADAFGFDFYAPNTESAESPVQIWFPVRRKSGQIATRT